MIKQFCDVCEVEIGIYPHVITFPFGGFPLLSNGLGKTQDKYPIYTGDLNGNTKLSLCTPCAEKVAKFLLEMKK